MKVWTDFDGQARVVVYGQRPPETYYEKCAMVITEVRDQAAPYLAKQFLKFRKEGWRLKRVSRSKEETRYFFYKWEVPDDPQAA